MQKEIAPKQAKAPEFTNYLQREESPPHIRNFSYSNAIAKGKTEEGYRFMLNERDMFALFMRADSESHGVRCLEHVRLDLFYVNQDGSLRPAGFCDSEIFIGDGVANAQILKSIQHEGKPAGLSPHFREMEKIRNANRMDHALWVHKSFSKGKGGDFTGLGELLTSVHDHYAKSKRISHLTIWVMSEAGGKMWRKHYERLGADFRTLGKGETDSIRVDFSSISEIPPPEAKRISSNRINF